MEVSTQPYQCGEVQMVGWLIKEENVRLHKQCTGQCNAPATFVVGAVYSNVKHSEQESCDFRHRRLGMGFARTPAIKNQAKTKTHQMPPEGWNTPI